MTKNVKSIEKKIAQKKNYLKETYGVKEIGIFGSVLRDDFNQKSSDIDIVVELSHKVPVGLFEFSKLKFELENLLGCKVDLITKNGIKPFLRDRILKQMIIVK